MIDRGGERSGARMESSSGSAQEARQGEWGSRPFTPDVQQRISTVLSTDIPHGLLAERQGPGRGRVKYVEHHIALDLANEAFGFGGWSCSILSQEFMYCERNQKKGWDCACMVQMRVQLENGSFHTDFGKFGRLIARDFSYF